MHEYQRLLLVADPAMRHGLAIKRATELAKVSGASLHVVVIAKLPGLQPFLDKGSQESAHLHHIETVNAWLREESDLLRCRGIPVSTEVVWSEDPLQSILQRVEENRPDMLIKDTQHEGLLKRTFITPLDWHLLRECALPVHLIGPSGHALPKVVIAAVDVASADASSERLNSKIIEQAQRLAQQCRAALHLVHALDLTRVYFGDATGSSVVWADLLGEVKAQLEKAFRRLAERHHIDADHCHLLMESPLQALPEFSEHLKADVMVMGRVHRSGLNRLVGSTTEHLLYRSPCGILAV